MVRHRAAAALGRAGGGAIDASQARVNALKDKDDLVRESAAWAAGADDGVERHRNPPYPHLAKRLKIPMSDCAWPRSRRWVESEKMENRSCRR